MKAGRKGVGLLRIVGPVWKEWWREVLAGWRRNEMSCLVGGCNRICSGRYWPAKPETMVLDAAKYAPRAFASGKPKLQKSIWRLTGWPLWLVNGNGRCWPAGAEKECADGLEAWGSGLLTGQDGNKDAACWKMCTSYFRA